jgi:hypothetical protein
VAGLGGGEGDLDGVAVAHLADEDDLWGLAEGGAQAAGVVVEVRAEFALGEGGVLVAMDEFDGVLESDDVDGLVTAWFSLISLRRAARVVVLPQPVAPVTRTMPFFSLEMSSKIGGSPSPLREGTSACGLRMTMAKLPRCLKILTRKRKRSLRA